MKVKEPLDLERKWLQRGQIIFTYLHLAADPELTRDLMASGVAAIAYETVTDTGGKLPLLAPMSKIAGRMAPQVAAHFRERPQGGRGILLGGINGVPAGQVVIFGGGVVGCNAAEIALGMGADVAILVRNTSAADRLSQRFGSRALVFATPELVGTLCVSADVVIGAALVPGAAAPKLISGGDRQTHETWCGNRRRFHRPGRLRRNIAPDNAHPPDIRRGRRCALLRGEHAGRGTEDINIRAK